MSSVTLSTDKSDRDQSSVPPQTIRETVESIVVAFILAFLFRAFVAEAFVIPTGSMAPTLMGAHKDIACELCGKQYQASASEEFDSETGRAKDYIVIASTCPTCRGLNRYDFRGNANHGTFSGDRILVSKFDYVLGEPDRWDVFVFKYPEKAHMNYIKRLIGLPGDELLIEGGDVFTRGGDGSWEIARKPPSKIRAMRQLVSDTQFQSPLLVEKGWPSLWQPWAAPDAPASQWQVQQAAGSWSASLSPTETTSLLRYFHRIAEMPLWESVVQGEQLPDIEPTSSELVTDFVAYNSSVLANRGVAYTSKSELKTLDEDITTEYRAYDRMLDRFRSSLVRSPESNRGLHWVGDLIGDFDIEIASQSGNLVLQLVEFGVTYECEVDVASGEARVTARVANEAAGSDSTSDLDVFDGASQVSGTTGLRGPGTYHIEFANVDDQLVLWVNGKLADFSQPLQYNARDFRSSDQRRPYWTESDPLDAAPIAIGGRGLEMTVKRAVVHRDIYYIAPQLSSNSSPQPFSDYNPDDRAVIAAVPDASIRRVVDREAAIRSILAHPRWWDETSLWSLRGGNSFALKEGQYFPMGDNSAASYDGRMWFGHHYVEEDLVLGRALMVFWPHTWNRPIPFLPNFSRMSLIH